MTRSLRPAAALALTLLLVGCQGLSDRAALYAERQEEMTQIAGDVWRIQAVWPWEDEPIKLREYLLDQAQRQCRRLRRSSQPREAVSQRRVGLPGSEAALVFRCVRPLPSPDRGLSADHPVKD